MMLTCEQHLLIRERYDVCRGTVSVSVWKLAFKSSTVQLGQMGLLILYRCSQKECEPSLKKGQCLEDVIFSTMNKGRHAGLN